MNIISISAIFYIANTTEDIYLPLENLMRYLEPKFAKYSVSDISKIIFKIFNKLKLQMEKPSLNKIWKYAANRLNIPYKIRFRVITMANLLEDIYFNKFISQPQSKILIAACIEICFPNKYPESVDILYVTKNSVLNVLKYVELWKKNNEVLLSLINEYCK